LHGVPSQGKTNFAVGIFLISPPVPSSALTLFTPSGVIYMNSSEPSFNFPNSVGTSEICIQPSHL